MPPGGPGTGAPDIKSIPAVLQESLKIDIKLLVPNAPAHIVMDHRMPGRNFPIVLLLVMMSATAGSTSWAGCTDLPKEKVDWRSCNLSGIDFPGADVTGGNLRGAALSNSNLSATNFSGIDGYRVRFVESDLSDAVFDGARLTGARFDRANLSGASMRNVQARDAKFLFADLTGVDLTGAVLRDVDFTGAVLSSAIWTDGTKVCAEGSRGVCR